MFAHASKEKNGVRTWLHYGKANSGCARIEFYWWSSHCGISFGFDDEHGWGFSISLPPFAIYLHADLARWTRLKGDREISLRFHSCALWWDVWRDPIGGWSSDVPKWRNGSFHIADFFLGKTTCSTEIKEQRDILVPMPEGTYRATAKLVQYTWRRPRWFARSFPRCEIEIPKGIPHAGKGTTAYNCGDDATFGITTGECHSIADGVGMLVGSSLRDRVRYGGWSDWAWNRPATDK